MSRVSKGNLPRAPLIYSLAILEYPVGEKALAHMLIVEEEHPVPFDSGEMRSLVTALLSDYGLNKVQLSSLLQVSRPTLDAWLKGPAGSVRPSNKAKVEVLKKVLDDELTPENKGLLGRMLMKKTHPKIRDFQKSLCNPVLDESALRSAISPLNQAIRGMLKGDRLTERLKSMPDRNLIVSNHAQ